MASDELSYDFFFYGTLCHPAILDRVLQRRGSDKNQLIYQDAVLPGYTRHHVKGEDYPALVVKESSLKLLANSREDSSSDKVDFSTRGSLVSGLNVRNIKSLDVFEGSQYTRYQLPIKLIHPSSNETSVAQNKSKSAGPLEHIMKSVSLTSSGTTTNDVEAGSRTAWVYVWNDDLKYLEPKTWDYKTFVQDKSQLWTGTTTREYDDVERLHASQSSSVGSETLVENEDGVKEIRERARELAGQKKEEYPDFGHGMLKYWGFAEGYLNFNNGAYGSPPLPVLEAMRALSDECESCPDLFMKRSYLPHLRQCRERIAGLIGATLEEVVIVPGATSGMNMILREIEWCDGDIIVAYNTTYGAVAQTLKYLGDRNPSISIQIINLDFPLTHAEVLAKTEEVLRSINTTVLDQTGMAKPTGIEEGRRVRGLVIDQIASNPGVRYPWEALVEMCKQYGVLSIVDAAHAIGQEQTNVKASDPDFWVSNCHKWLYAHRACAVMYVPLRNQGMIKSSMPTGAGYESARYPTPGGRQWDFTSQYDWIATQDFTPYISINSALDFRSEIGGEERIMTYCHAIAVAGGERLMRRWQGRKGAGLMDTEKGELTAAMLNVFLPDIDAPKDDKEIAAMRQYIDTSLFEANAFCGVYLHAGRVCARLSCQVWNELEDFDRIADILEHAIRGVSLGKHWQSATEA